MARSSGSEERLLPAPVPAAAAAAISPSALVLAGAGTAVGLVVGLPALLAVLLGAGCWGVRVGAGAALAAGRRRRALRPETIDPYAVTEPWRSFVRESLSAQARFDQVAGHSQPGPLRDRLVDVSARMHAGVVECWRVAHLGSAASAALAAIDPDETARTIRGLQASRPSLGSASANRAADQSEAALAAQLQAARRIEAAVQRTTDRLRVLTAELNGAVASAAELSLGEHETNSAAGLAGAVDSAVGEIEAMRRALEEMAINPIPRGNQGRPAV